jgi:hypothetical protein
MGYNESHLPLAPLTDWDVSPQVCGWYNNVSKYGFAGVVCLGSDTAGDSWHVTGKLAGPVNEVGLALLQNGSVLLNMRSAAMHRNRVQSMSTDGGATFSALRDVFSLPDPVCNGGVTALPGGTVVLTHDALTAGSVNRTRANMSLFTSTSGGDSWSNGYVLWRGPSAYSTVTPLGGANVGVLYERGFEQDIENITFASVDTTPPATVASLKSDDAAPKNHLQTADNGHDDGAGAPPASTTAPPKGQRTVMAWLASCGANWTICADFVLRGPAKGAVNAISAGGPVELEQSNWTLHTGDSTSVASYKPEFTAVSNGGTDGANGRRAVQVASCPGPEDFFLGTLEERSQCTQQSTLAACIAKSCELDAQGRSTGCAYSLKDTATGGKSGSCDAVVVVARDKTSAASQATIATVFSAVAALMFLA